MVFEITHASGKARSGFLHTAHGKVQTPFYMPVASKGTVKAMSATDITDLGFESIITNSFILSLSPGVDVVEKLGGIHNFMGYKKNIFTDSGGFQVLSKDFLIKKTEDGAIFRDKSGKKSLFTPEISMENQIKLGSDVAMTFDDVAHYGMDGHEYVNAIKRTHVWAKRCFDHHKQLKRETGSEQLIFGICQGGVSPEYRRFSTHKINQIGFDGVALGGLVIGESREELFESISEAVKCFDTHKVKYLMGLGSPPDIVRAVGMGVDCFDSIYPTSNARHGSMITSTGRIMIRKTIYKYDEGPIEDGCQCDTCKRYSKAYLHHLIRTHELLGYKLATVHNLFFMNKLMTDIRAAIKKGRYDEFARDFLEKYFSKNEKKNFSSNIAQKYREEEKRKRAVLYLDYRN